MVPAALFHLEKSDTTTVPKNNVSKLYGLVRRRSAPAKIE